LVFKKMHTNKLGLYSLKYCCPNMTWLLLFPQGTYRA
jgi:hypothetical protein